MKGAFSLYWLFNAFIMKNTSSWISGQTIRQMRYYECVKVQTLLAGNHVAESEFSTKAAASNALILQDNMYWRPRLVCNFLKEDEMTYENDEDFSFFQSLS